VFGFLKWGLTGAALFAWWQAYNQKRARDDWQALKEDQYLQGLANQLSGCIEEQNRARTSSIVIRTTFDQITTGLTALLTGGNPKAVNASRAAVQNYLSAINIESDSLPPVCKTAIDKAEALGIDVGEGLGTR
jgi:hypothetical protein